MQMPIECYVSFIGCEFI